MCLAVGREVHFYTSPNLIDWTFGSRLDTGYGGGAGVWETPDLFELPIDGTDTTAWVLLVGVGDGAPAGGSGVQYFVGRFDGRTFTPFNPPETTLWFDYGADFYAPQSWSDTPDNRRLVIGWMNNWAYARQLPTGTWRGAMTLPRAVGLVATDAGLRLTQRPAVDLADAFGRAAHCHQNTVVTQDTASVFDVLGAQAWQLDICLTTAAPQSTDIEIRLHFGAEDQVTLLYLGAEKALVLDRQHAGIVDFHDAFPGRQRAPLTLVDGVLDLQLLVDSSSLELFTCNGRLAMTKCIFPRTPLTAIEIVTRSRRVTIEQLRIVSLVPAP